MNFRKMLIFLAMTVSTLCSAQTPTDFSGSWKVTWQGETRPQEAKLVINDTVGTWKTFASSRYDGCVGKEVQISLERVSDVEAIVKLKFSEAVTGCADGTIKLKKIDEKNMTGLRGKAELTVVRQ